MINYKVIKSAECLTQPVNGNHSGQWLHPGDGFATDTTTSGWAKVADKRWFPVGNCTIIGATPEPDPEPMTGEIMRQSFSHDGGLTYPAEEDKYWKLVE